MTKEEGVACLRAWKNHYVPKFNLDFGPGIKRRITSGLENVYLTALIEDLIERIRNSEFDPITEVAMYYYEMDEILALSDDDHFVTHRFAGFMEESAHDILNFLQKIEAELVDDIEQGTVLKKVVKGRIQKYLNRTGILMSPDEWMA